MNSKNLIEALREQTAVRMIESLSEEDRREILSIGVVGVLKDLRLGWEVNKILEKEALRFAHEYAQRPEVQEKLQAKAKEAVDDILDGIVVLIGKAIEDDIKSKYGRILSEKKYGEL